MKEFIKSVWKRWRSGITRELVYEVYVVGLLILVSLVGPIIATIFRFFTYGINTIIGSSSCNVLVEKFWQDTQTSFLYFWVLALIGGIFIIPIAKLVQFLFFVIDELLIKFNIKLSPIRIIDVMTYPFSLVPMWVYSGIAILIILFVILLYIFYVLGDLCT